VPKVIDPPQGYIANWNNLPSAGWTNGDAPAAERNAGPLHRGAYLMRVVARAAAAPSYDALKGVEREAGATAQQRVLLDARLRAAQAAASGAGRTVLDTIVAWDGNYDRQDGAGTVDPGVAAFEELKQASERTLGAAAVRWLGQRGGSHPFDVGAAEAAALNRARTADLVRAAGRAAATLQQRFGSADPAGWREPRKLYDVSVQGVADKPRLEFFDRGTWSQAAEVGP
jgi:hypothetical protein